MNDTVVKTIQAALDRGDKVLVVPVKEGVRLFRFERKEIKLDYGNVTHERKR